MVTQKAMVPSDGKRASSARDQPLPPSCQAAVLPSMSVRAQP
ncbi:hypothetical protein [Streptomyces longispororuber]|nr:hypothetical protein [Streptomyces longispororuber]